MASSGCVRTYAEEVARTVAARPALEEALAMAAAQRCSADDQQVIIVVHDIAKLARHSRELIKTAAAVQRAQLCLQILTGALRGVHDPEADAPGLFGVLAAAARLDQEYVTEKSKAGARAASVAGVRGGRPRIVNETMLAEARRLRDEGLPIPEIARRLVIPSGRNAGRHPSLATVYRALAEPEPIASPQPPAGLHAEEHDHVLDRTSGTDAGNGGNRPGTGDGRHRGGR